MHDFKTLTGNTKYLSYKDWSVGGFVVGTVTSFKSNSKNPKVQDVVVDVIESNLKTPTFSLKKDEVFTINGTTALERVLGSVEEGDIIKVTFLGKEEVKTGEWKGTKANKLEVQVAAAQDKAKLDTTSNEDEGLV